MNILDIILLVCFVPALIMGLKKGFIAQAVAIVSIILGVWLSSRFANMFSEWIGQYIHGSGQILRIVAFALIFVGVIFGLYLLGKVLEGTIKLVMLGWLNKLLGVIFAFLKTGLIVGLLIIVFCSINNAFHLVSEQYLNSSVLFPPLKSLAYNVFPYVKDMLTLK